MDETCFQDFTCSARQVEVLGKFSGPPSRGTRACVLLRRSEIPDPVGPEIVDDRGGISLQRWVVPILEEGVSEG